MDRQKLQQLIAKIDAVSTSQDKETVLTLDEYFDGNTEEYSILCANTEKSPSAEELCRFLCEIEDQADVSQLLVRVYDYGDALEYGDCWINSDTVFVVTTASIDAVRDWFAPLAYSDIYEETDFRTFNNFPPVPHGFRVFGVWWDQQGIGAYNMGLALGTMPEEMIYDCNMTRQTNWLSRCNATLRNVYGVNMLTNDHLRIDIGGASLADRISHEGWGTVVNVSPRLWTWILASGGPEKLVYDNRVVADVRDTLKRHGVFFWQQ